MPSKSVTHRALVAASLADGVSTIRGPLDADDTRRTLEGLRALGVRVEAAEGAWTVHGTGGVIPGGAAIDLGASGTSARFLTAVACLGERSSRLDGDRRLRERPLLPLIRALQALGASIEAEKGTLPFFAGGSRVRGGSVTIAGDSSSQFASALLLAASAFEEGLRLEVGPPRVSYGYVGLTLDVLERFGAAIASEDEGRFAVSKATLRPATMTIEGDHSSASYWLAAAAIVGGRVRIAGLRADSKQPDARLLADLASLGCKVEADATGVTIEGTGNIPAFSWNLADAPDLAPTASALACYANGPCELSGLHHLAMKESDRLAALRDNLRRLGARVLLHDGTLSIDPPRAAERRGALIDVCGDHRIAMAFAVVGLKTRGVTIGDAEAVSKSYPAFWDDLARLVRTGS